MTNDEAINTLKNAAWLGWAEQAEKVSEAVRMAVEALKRETSGDAISRHDAIDALMEILDRPNHAEFLYTDEICKALNELSSVQSEPCDDAVSREAVLDEIYDSIKKCEKALASGVFNEKERFGIECEMKSLRYSLDVFENLPSVHPEPISDVYMKAVWTWLLDYQIKAAELKGRYTPYEVLSWVANDWRKEHEGSD